MFSPITYSRFAMGVSNPFGTMRIGLRTGTSLSSAKLKINQPDDAVKVTLSTEAKQKAAALAELAQQPQKKKSPGAIGGLLGRLSAVTSQIQNYTSRLNSEQLTNDQRNAIGAEINNLTSEFQSITTSKEFTRIMELSQFAQVNLQGGNPSDVYSAFKPEAGLLGDDFLSLLQHGSVYQLGLLGSSLNKISATDIQAAIADPALLNDLAATIKSAEAALQAPALDSEIATKPAATAVQQEIFVPQKIDAIFAGAGETALALNTFSATDMIQSAMAGLDLGPISVLTLVRNPTDLENKGLSNPA